MKDMAFDPFLFENTEISDIPVYYKKVPWVSGWFRFRIIFRAGAVNDPIGKEGLAHFFEHIPFRGSKKFPSYVEIEEVNRKVFLGFLNAHTGDYFIQFSGKVALEDSDTALEFFRDMIFNPLLNPSDIEKERKVILSELRRIFPNKAYEEIHRAYKKDVFHSHPIGRFLSFTGSEESLKSINKEDLLWFKETYFHSGNMTILLTGDVDETLCKKWVTTLTEGIPRKESNPRPELIKNAPGPLVNERIFSMKELVGSASDFTKTTGVGVYRLAKKPKKNVTGILTEMITDLIKNRLRLELGGVYATKAKSDLLPDSSLFLHFSVNVDNELAHLARKIIEEIINELQDPSKIIKVFEENKNKIIKQSQTLDYNLNSIADDAVYDIRRFNRIRSLEEILKDLKQVSVEDISNFAKLELTEDKLYWLITKP